MCFYFFRALYWMSIEEIFSRDDDLMREEENGAKGCKFFQHFYDTRKFKFFLLMVKLPNLNF